MLSLQYEWSGYFTGRKFKQRFDILGQIGIGVAIDQVNKAISKATDKKDENENNVDPGDNKSKSNSERSDNGKSDGDGSDSDKTDGGKSDSGKSDSGGSDSGGSDSGGGWWGKRKK